MSTSLEISNAFRFLNTSKSGTTPLSSKCEKCQKASCICGELTTSPTFHLKSRISPNNFKRHFIDSRNIRLKQGLNCILTPSHSRKNGLYIPYITSKKKVSGPLAGYQSHSSLLFQPSHKQNRIPINSQLKKSFEVENENKQKIIEIGIKYLKDPECRYQRTKGIEMLYNIIRKGDKADYAVSTKKKLVEIAEFLVKKNNELQLQKFLLQDSNSDEKAVMKFDEFLKAFISNFTI